MSEVGTEETEESDGAIGLPRRPAPMVDWSPALHQGYWEFHARWHDHFFEYAHFDLRSEAAALTAVDTTFHDLMRQWPRVSVMEKPAAYAWTVLKKRIIDQGRRRRRTPIPVDDGVLGGLLDEQVGGVDPFDTLVENIALHDAIGRLPERQREAVTHCYLLGRSTTEAAEILDIDAATIRSHLHRAKRRLARELRIPITPTGDGKASS
ncbi:sigma-70 family RNA polymerase sigma factor [Streptomyces sp. NPDC051921]|uniref:sigma-70 family RNA polymerase sigma factor n=1 Tax=Streptomyces sp. NPDC051921 TaxID=3155806 RepID=UPI00342BCB5D